MVRQARPVGGAFSLGEIEASLFERLHFGGIKMTRHILLLLLVSVAMVVGCTSSDTVTWKEEVALHDGSKIMVTRSHTYDDYGEIGQGRLIAGRTITFTIPGTTKEVVWKSDRSLDMLALDFQDGVPYIVGSPTTCPAFNIWGRPNPPYVLFKYGHNEQWQRKPLNTLPAEANTNLVVDTKSEEKLILEEMRKTGFVSVGKSKLMNRNLSSDLRTILNSKIKFGPGNYTESCPVLICSSLGKCSSPNGPVAPHPIP